MMASDLFSHKRTPMHGFRMGLVAAIAAISLVGCATTNRSTPRNEQSTADASASLFDGTTLAGWSGDERFWRVEDGQIIGEATADNPLPHNTFLVFDTPIVGDFKLSAEVRLTGNNNSGIQYRAKPVGEFGLHGYQCDIHPNDSYTGMLYDEGGRGIVAEQGSRLRIEPDGTKVVIEDQHPVVHYDLSKWHTFTIIAQGNRLEHRVDGKTTVVVEDNQEGFGAIEGHIGLQLHAGAPYTVRFREVRLRHR